MQQLVRRLPAVRGMLLEAPHDERAQRARHARAMGRHRLRDLRHLRGEGRLRRRRHDGRPATQHLVADHARGVDIGAMVHVRVRRGLLRRHVGGRAEGYSEGGEGRATRRRAHCLRDAEIRHLCMLSGDEDVLGLHVPVYDTLRVGVR